MIKTKYIISILTIFIILSVTGCTSEKDFPTEPDSTNDEQIFTITESESMTDEEVESSIFEEITVSEFNQLPDDIKGTIIPIDSLLLYHAETGKEYDDQDSHMLWRTLQYAFGNFGVNYNRAEIKDYTLTVEPMTIGEFTTAILDGDYNDYTIPEELNDDIWYDSNEDMYCFGLGDRGASQTEIITYQYLEDHNLKITARLFGLDDNLSICEGTFYFKRNNYASGVVEPLFYYTVTNAEFTKESIY